MVPGQDLGGTDFLSKCPADYTVERADLTAAFWGTGIVETTTMFFRFPLKRRIASLKRHAAQLAGMTGVFGAVLQPPPTAPQNLVARPRQS